MNLETLCRNIGLAQAAQMAVLETPQVLPAALLEAVTCPATAEKAGREIVAYGDPARRGLDVLAYYLMAATKTYDAYRRAGIDDTIFFDTMACFSRFVGEYCESHGVYGFDRAWWAYRQLSMTLFRIGSLEYEYKDEDGEVHLHIPSGVDLALPVCAASLAQFHDFTRQYNPVWLERPISVHTWLLSPALEALLPPQSKILQFQHCFRLERWNREDLGFLTWVYGREETDYSKLPENTTLQRNMKAYLLRGGQVGTARGLLVDFKA